MQNLFLILSLILSLNSFGSISIVSDLDDTIKITNSGQEIEGGIRALLKKDVFTGVPDFFSAARLYTNELHILSASPKILREKIVSTLARHQIKFESLILKDGIGGESKLDYKVKALKKMLDSSPDDFILMGDDVGQDPEAYVAIKALYPDRVLAIYIHVINGRNIHHSTTRYWTSFDLFMREHMAGRMLPSWVGAAAEITLLEKKMKFIFPHFAECPTTTQGWDWQLATEFAQAASEVAQKLSQYCLSRNSGN